METTPSNLFLFISKLPSVEVCERMKDHYDILEWILREVLLGARGLGGELAPLSEYVTFVPL